MLTVWGFAIKMLFDQGLFEQGSLFNSSEGATTEVSDQDGKDSEKSDGSDKNATQPMSGVGLVTSEYLLGEWTSEQSSSEKEVLLEFTNHGQVDLVYGDKSGVGRYQLYDLYGEMYIDILGDFGVISFQTEYIDRKQLLFTHISTREEVIIYRDSTSTKNHLIPDRALKEAILKSIGKSSDKDITHEDLYQLTELANTDGVKDLTGLGWAFNLESLNLTHATVNDLSPIMDLRRVRYIGLQSKMIDEQMMEQLQGIGLMYDLTLDLSYSQFSSWDVAKQLVQEDHFPFLKTLVVVDTNLEKNNIDYFKEARSEIEIITQPNRDRDDYLATVNTSHLNNE